MPNRSQAGESSTVSISVGRVRVGDVVSLPGTTVHRCLVQAIKSVGPGVRWLYLTDQAGRRLSAHVALPLNQALLLHELDERVDGD